MIPKVCINPKLIRFAFVALLAGCGSDPDSLVINDLTFRENPKNVLSGWIEFKTEVATRARIEVIDESGDTVQTLETDQLETSHSIPILGLLATSTYELSVVASDDAEVETAPEQVSHTTGALPDALPEIRVTVSRPDEMAPGLTLFSLFRWAEMPDRVWGMLVAVDPQGRVIWYHETADGVLRVVQLSDGNIAYIAAEHGVIVLDPMGNELVDLRANDIGLNTFHHELFEMPNGNVAFLTNELRQIDGYDDGMGGTTTYDVVGDSIAEMTRDGNIEIAHSTFDIFDPLRTRDGFHVPFWAYEYPESAAPKDWTHGNAIIYDEADDSYIVSFRNQDWVTKIDRSTGELLWRLGEDGDFTMLGDGEFAFHQHAPELQPDGSMLLYDNGNARSTLGPGELPYSRVVQYALDTDAMTVEQVWEYRGEEAYFAPLVGDADGLANGNVLITDGCIVADPAVPVFNPTNLRSIRIAEVTRTDTPETVFEVIIDETNEQAPAGYVAYRALRIQSLYP